MTAKGYGEDRLLITDKEIAKLKTVGEKEAAHQKNRRTDFRVLKTDYVPHAADPNQKAPVIEDNANQTPAPENK